MENTTNIKVYKSDGDDGYDAGTWGYSVTRGTNGTIDGGFPSREMARAAAQKAAKASVHWD